MHKGGSPEEKPLTAGDMLVPVLLASSMGFLVGAAIFGTTEVASVVFDEDKMIAFFSALGTWIVGFGAWYYAKQSHMLRLEGIEREKKEEERNAAEAFNTLRAAVIACKIPHQTFVEAGDWKRSSAHSLRLLAKTAAAAAPNSTSLLSSCAMSDDEYLAKTLVLTGLLSMFVALSEIPQQEGETPFLSATPWVRGQYEAAMKAAENLSIEAKVVLDYLDEVRPTLFGTI